MGAQDSEEIGDLAVSVSALMELLPDGVCVTDVDGQVRAVNDRFLEIVGLEREQVVGVVPPFPWWPPDRREPERIGSKDGARYETEFVRGDGERFPASVSVRKVDWGTGRGLLAVLHDLSEERTERRRRRDAEMAAALATWEWDPETDLVEASAEFIERAGFERRETLTDFLEYIPQPHADAIREGLEALAAGEQDELSYDSPIEPPNPEMSWIEIRARPLRDETGAVRAVVGVTLDATERHRVEEELTRNRVLLNAAERLSDVGSFESDDRSGTAVWSDNLYRLFGVEDREETRRIVDAQKIVHERDREDFLAAREAVKADGVPRSLEHRYVRGGEELRWAETRLEPLRDGDEIVGVRGTMQDITERRRAVEQARLRALLLDVVETAVVMIDFGGRVRYWNAAAEELFGWTADEAMGMPVTELVARQFEPMTAEEMVRAAEEAGTRWRGQLEIRRKDGSHLPVLVQASFYDDERGQPAGMVGTAVDLSERVELEERLRAAGDYLQAVTDSIGEGVYTLDGEGKLTYANPATERILGWSADELRGRAMHEVIHFRRRDGSAYPIEECPAVGVASTREPVHIEDDIFIAKDGTEIDVEYTAAPIETQAGVEGAVVVFSDIRERKRREGEMARQAESLMWMGRIHDALEHDRFEVHSQPIVELKTDRVSHHELLIRMRAPDGDLIPPGRFLPIAEELGVVSEIDAWMLERAAELAAQGHPVTVNLSAQSIGQAQLPTALETALRRTGADPGLIMVELTETAVLENEAEASAFIRRLREIGCHLALDDFGTGYGGFSYLKRLPVDFLKIDREFVGDLATDQASRHVVTAVVNLAQGFGQRTIAEGVEDAETLDALRALEVDYAQGFHLGRPAPVSAALDARPMGAKPRHGG